MTYMIADIDGEVSEFGGTDVIAALARVAQRQRLAALRRFLNRGFTTEIDALINDLESIDFGYTYIADYVEEFIETLRASSEIAILTMGVE